MAKRRGTADDSRTPAKRGKSEKGAAGRSKRRASTASAASSGGASSSDSVADEASGKDDDASSASADGHAPLPDLITGDDDDDDEDDASADEPKRGASGKKRGGDEDEEDDVEAKTEAQQAVAALWAEVQSRTRSRRPFDGLAFPSARDVQRQSLSEGQAAMFTAMASRVTVRTLRSLLPTLGSFAAVEHMTASAVPDASALYAANDGEGASASAAETLWAALRQANAAAHAEIETALDGLESRSERTASNRTQASLSASFRSQYLAAVTSQFADELDELRRDASDFDGKRVSLLIECLHNGADVVPASEQAMAVEQGRALPVHGTQIKP